MTIAICSAVFLANSYHDDLFDIMVATAGQNSNQQFVFIGPTPPSHLSDSPNVQYVISQPMVNHPLFWQFWLNYTVPAIVKKRKADVLLHLNGTCSLRTLVPQYQVISDLAYQELPSLFSKKQVRFLKRFMPRFWDKAAVVLALSDFTKEALVQKSMVSPEKIHVAQLNPPGNFHPLSFEEKEEVKVKFTQGKEYFMFFGDLSPVNNLMALLKAFTFFKTRQKSNMHLVLVTKAGPAYDDLADRLKAYKFRKEVVLLSNLPPGEIQMLTAAAYAFVQPSRYDATGFFILRAMLCNVPVITGQDGLFHPSIPPCVLSVDPMNHEDIAHKMMALFKDESLRDEIRSNAGEMIRHRKTTSFDWFSSMIDDVKIQS